MNADRKHLRERNFQKLAAAAAEDPDSTAPPIDRTRYRLKRELGRGGMGVVYEAWDLELKRTVAIKVLSETLARDEEARRRFVREGQSAARLNHPNIAAVYDASDTMLVMQWIDGVPLSRFPREDRRQLVTLVRDAARAVHHANERGIIHRDLKPANLMVEDGRVMVTDFGLAKEIALTSSLSLSGRILGTPAMMAPEQAEGRLKEIDPRTDVYGLGATLYDLLAGRPPFLEQDVYRLLRLIVEVDPPPVRRFQAEVPRDLDTIISKCLAKEKERRYASAKALAEDLERWLNGRPVLAQPLSLPYKVAKFVLRRKALAAVTTIAGVLLAVGLLLLSVQRRAADQALRLATRVEACLDDARYYQQTGDMQRRSDLLSAAQEDCERYLETHDLGHAHSLYGRVLLAKGQEELAERALNLALAKAPDLKTARYERGSMLAKRWFRERLRGTVEPAALDELRKRAIEDLDQAISTNTRLRDLDMALARGERARLLGEYQSAEQEYRRVLQMDPANNRARLALSELELVQGDPDAARNLAMSALDIVRGLGPAYMAKAEEHDAVERVSQRHELTALEQTAGAQGTVEGVFKQRGELRLQLNQLEAALSDFDEALKQDPSDALAYGQRGVVHARRAVEAIARGDLDQAMAEWQAAVRDYQQATMLDSSLAGAFNNRGVAHLELCRLWLRQHKPDLAAQQLDQAEADFDRAIQTAPRFALAFWNRGLGSRLKAKKLGEAGNFQAALARLAQARRDFDRALQLRPDDAALHYDKARGLEMESNLRTAAGDIVNAAGSLSAALHHYDQSIRNSPNSLAAITRRGYLRLQNNDPDGCRADLKRALHLGPPPADRAEIERTLAGFATSSPP